MDLNRKLIDLNNKRRLEFRLTPELLHPWWRRCTVKVLIVTDGGLDFGEGDFGLSTFVRVLKDEAPSRVRFELTLAHIRNVSDAKMLASEPGIANRITGFRFDDPSHFTVDMYDQVWLFGIESTYNDAAIGRGPSLSDAEIKILYTHMERGGGIFATGDHGYLGRALCSRIPRVRNMRYWDDFENGQVSMTGPWRNDTNQIGNDPGSQFSDQSDDVPQKIDLVLYSTWLGGLRAARYPHPLLCGRMGRIDVLPDHPHEGECRVPPDVTLNLEISGTEEYPLNIIPEVIAWSHVPAGNVATLRNASKEPTIAHTFGAISAYDGHRAGGRGRVVCDATWHHFVNVNLIGLEDGDFFDDLDLAGENDPGKLRDGSGGFLSSLTGIAAFNKIKNYYTNIGVWISPPERHRCFNRAAWWELVFAERIMEAALVSPEVALERIPASTLMFIGIHARDVLGRKAGQCQTISWVIDWVKEFKLMDVRAFELIRIDKEDALPLPVVDPMPLVDTAIGAALVLMRQQFPMPPEKATEKDDAVAIEAIEKGLRFGFELAVKQTAELNKVFAEMLNMGK